jgi:tetratricopeptide (TPR) repeat protein
MTREERREKREESKIGSREADFCIPRSPLPTPYSPLPYLLIVICYLFSACSSAPRNTGDVYDARKDAEVQLEQGTREADRGNYAAALVFMNEAKRLAVITDNSSLLIRSGLSRGNVLFATGNAQEAAEAWNKALEEAVFAGNKELAAVCRIHIARGKLLSRDAAQSVRDEVTQDMSQIKSDEMYIAFAWTVIGFAENELGRYTGAEEAVKRALVIHEKARSLELAAYDWFLIASFRSLSGNSDGALKALESAIEYDRRTENSWGLANDWQAFGDVQKKAGNRDAANAAYTRAAAIFRAIGDSEAAEKALARRE